MLLETVMLLRCQTTLNYFPDFVFAWKVVEPFYATTVSVIADWQHEDHFGDDMMIYLFG